MARVVRRCGFARMSRALQRLFHGPDTLTVPGVDVFQKPPMPKCRSGMNVYNQNGVVVGRFGQGRGPLGNQPLGNLQILSDQNGRQRILLAVFRR